MDTACVDKFIAYVIGCKIEQGFVHKHCFPVSYFFIEFHPAELLKKFSRRHI